MAKRNVVWTRTADIQFVGILEYWAKRNKTTSFSKKLLKLVTQRTLEISDDPFIYKSTDFNDVRVSSLKNYSLYYKVTDQQIIVTAFWDNRQNPIKLLNILQNGE